MDIYSNPELAGLVAVVVAGVIYAAFAGMTGKR